MGFYLSKLNDGNLGTYFGSQTMYSISDNGAFDTAVSDEIKTYVDNNEGVIAAVDESGVEHFLSVLKNGNCHGRDIELLINEVTQNYPNGFMVWN